jgi:hypothetical protein
MHIPKGSAMPRSRTCARKWRAARAECLPVSIEEAIDVLLSIYARAPLTRSWHAACTDCVIIAPAPALSSRPSVPSFFPIARDNMVCYLNQEDIKKTKEN